MRQSAIDHWLPNDYNSVAKMILRATTLQHQVILRSYNSNSNYIQKAD